MTDRKSDLLRLRYRRGQVFSSSDLRDQGASEDERRWWHNRAIHEASGVAMGMTVTPLAGAAGAPVFSVQPGVAYDCAGREIVLLREARITIDAKDLASLAESDAARGVSRLAAPPVLPGLPVEPGLPPNMPPIIFIPPRFFPFESHEVKLVIVVLVRRRGGTDCGCGCHGAVSEPCLPLAAGASPATVELDYILGSEPIPGDAAPVARVQFVVTSFFGSSSVVPVILRRFARPVAKPYVASGATLPGRTLWTLWNHPPDADNPLGFEVRVNTAAAGFTDIPLYIAQLEGRLFDPRDPAFVPMFYGQVAETQPDEFTFRLFTPRVPLPGRGGKTANDNFPSSFPAFAQEHDLHVSWLGIQPGVSPFHFAASPGGGSP